MANSEALKFVIWERLSKNGKWCPYSPEVCQLLEQNWKKEEHVVSLGDADDSLKMYSINLKNMIQVSSVTGTKSNIRRRLCDCLDSISSGCTWQWRDNEDSWHIYDVDVNNFIENAYLKGVKNITLNKMFRGYRYEIDFTKMLQINKQTKRKRPIRRQQNSAPYPVTNCSEDCSVHEDIIATCPSASELGVTEYPDLSKEIPGTAALVQQANAYMENVKRTYASEDQRDPITAMDVEIIENGDYCEENQLIVNDSTTQVGSSPSTPSSQINTTVALVNGNPWYGSRPPHTPQSKLKPVPGIEPLPMLRKKTNKRKKVTHGSSDVNDSELVLEEYTNKIEINSLNTNEDQMCIICYESLSEGSSYDDDTSLLQLKLCSHIFHKSCLLAMYNSGPKDKCLQCPVCKKIHGEKFGIQPPGNMIFHVIPYSLPGYPECETIRIIYDISSGIQGPEHPNPGKKYTARGFPRHCFLPDNEMGRKILRLLVKAWRRRLIFTIGSSSTTGEDNTVTWNEIHHKTEFGFSRRGHGYPDPNYFDNVLSELEAHGVRDDDVYLWYPA